MCLSYLQAATKTDLPWIILCHRPQRNTRQGRGNRLYGTRIVSGASLLPLTEPLKTSEKASGYVLAAAGNKEHWDVPGKVCGGFVKKKAIGKNRTDAAGSSLVEKSIHEIKGCPSRMLTGDPQWELWACLGIAKLSTVCPEGRNITRDHYSSGTAILPR